MAYKKAIFNTTVVDKAEIAFFLLLFNVILPMTPTREMSYFVVMIMHTQEDFGLLQPAMLMCGASVNAFC